jgi:glycosidase
MNYNFAFAVNDFFVADKNKISVDEFIEKLKQIDETYPAENLFVLQNLLTSHDTERLSSLIQNPDRKYDHDANEGNSNYNAGKPTNEIYEKQKLIVAFQILYRGAPMIYYGDEIGMWGADDPHCRKPMVWSDIKYDNEVIDENSGFRTGLGSFSVEQNKDLLKFYKDIIGLKNSNDELSRGAINFIYSNNDKKAFAFENILDDKKTICIFNLGATELSITLDFNLTEIYSGKKEELKNTINDMKIIEPNMPILISQNSFAIYKVK